MRASFVLLAICVLVGTGCKKKDDSTTASKYLYVTSGVCYPGGGNTGFTNLTSSNLVYRINVDTGARDSILADYNSSPSNTGDSPVGIVDNGGSVNVLIENTSTTSLRRIETIDKTSGSRSIYSNNTTALSAQLRGMILLPDTYLLVSKSTALEKVKSGLNRLTIGANPWVSLSAPASGCTTNATLLSAMAVLNNGNIVFAHAAAGANRFGIVSAQGYSTAANCLNGAATVSSPNAAAYPTAMAYDGVNNKLIVAYAGNATTTDINSIYVYPINESTNTIGTGVKIYDASLFGSTSGWNFLLYGISAMVLDTTEGVLYVATAINTNTTLSNDQIVKLSYNPALIGVTNNLVLQPSAVPFYGYGFDTKCISSMMLAE